jgi:hypothetical protein
MAIPWDCFMSLPCFRRRIAVCLLLMIYHLVYSERLPSGLNSEQQGKSLPLFYYRRGKSTYLSDDCLTDGRPDTKK